MAAAVAAAVTATVPGLGQARLDHTKSGQASGGCPPCFALLFPVLTLPLLFFSLSFLSLSRSSAQLMQLKFVSASPSFSNWSLGHPNALITNLTGDCVIKNRSPSLPLSFAVSIPCSVSFSIPLSFYVYLQLFYLHLIASTYALATIFQNLVGILSLSELSAGSTVPALPPAPLHCFPIVPLCCLTFAHTLRCTCKAALAATCRSMSLLFI